VTSNDGNLIPIGESLENLKSPFKRGFRKVLNALSQNRPILPFRSGEANNELTAAPSLPARAYPVRADDRIQENHYVA
jgi:hypothetical protein